MTASRDPDRLIRAFLDEGDEYRRTRSMTRSGLRLNTDDSGFTSARGGRTS